MSGLLAARAGIVVVGAAFGVCAAVVGYGLDSPALWLTDAAVATAFAVVAAMAVPRMPATVVLAVATAAAWSLATFVPLGLYWHRATLIALLLAAPRAWPRHRLAQTAVIVAAVGSLTPYVWVTDLGALALSGAVAAVVGVLRNRLLLRVAAVAAVTFLLLAAGWRLVLPDPHLLPLRSAVYAIGLLVVAWFIVERIATDPAMRIADDAVRVSAQPKGLRDRLASATRDPGLDIAWQRAGESTFLDESGEPSSWAPGPGRSAIDIAVPERGRVRILCSEEVARDARTVEALRRAVLLTEESQRLDAALHARMHGVSQSRARLVTRGDEERAQIRRDLDRDVVAPLRALRDQGLPRPAREHAELALRQLVGIPAGLPPSELDEGIVSALKVLGRRTPVPVEVDATETELPPEIAAAIYYACAEALTNVVKHANAEHARIVLSGTRGTVTVTVADDGRGGVRTDGRGIVGVVDRVEALGGSVRIDSPSGVGTTLAICLPKRPLVTREAVVR